VYVDYIVIFIRKMLLNKLYIQMFMAVNLVVSCPFSGIDCSLTNTIHFISRNRLPTWLTFELADMIHEHGNTTSFLMCAGIAHARGDFGVVYRGKSTFYVIHNTI